MIAWIRSLVVRPKQTQCSKDAQVKLYKALTITLGQRLTATLNNWTHASLPNHLMEYSTNAVQLSM